MINVLINATTIVAEEGTQSATEFIQAAVNRSTPDITWHYAVSRPVARNLLNIGQNLRCAYFFEHSPADSKSDRKRLKAIEENTDADVVLTLVGPAYVRFDVPHICGVAEGWAMDSMLRSFRSAMGVREIATDMAQRIYKRYWYNKADQWIVEAPYAKQGLVDKLRLPDDDVVVLPSTAAEKYAALEREILALGAATADTEVELDS